jgi:multicomponent Na+:H+ antiporter subunit G
MDDIRTALAILAVIVGTAFSLVGLIGFIRLPDVYTRLHATGKVSVFGVVFLLVAATLITPVGAGRAAVLILLLVVGGPTASHALASAAWRTGILPKQTIRDDLTERHGLETLRPMDDVRDEGAVPPAGEGKTRRG